MKRTNENKYTMVFVVTVIVAVLAVSAVSAFGMGFLQSKPTGADQTQEQAIQTAVANNDYAAWKSLMEQEIAKMQAQITEDNFNKIVEQNTQAQSMQKEQDSLKTAIEGNDYSSWKSLMEAQITEDNFNKIVVQFQKMNETHPEMDNTARIPENVSNAPVLSENQKALQTAVANNDYAAWKSLMESQITEENFNTIVAHYSEMKTQTGSSDKLQGAPDMHDGKGPMGRDNGMNLFGMFRS